MGRNNLPDDLAQRYREMLARVVALESAVSTRVPLNTIVGAPLLVQDTAGNTYLYAGPVDPDLADGAAQRGLLLYRQSGDTTVGTVALGMYTGSGNLPQTLGLFDALGNTCYSDDALAGQGLARPYLECGFGRCDSANWPSTSSGSFQDVFFGWCVHQHPRIQAEGRVIAPTGVDAALQLTGNGLTIGAPLTVTGATGVSQPFTLGPFAWAGNHMDELDLRLQARISSGAGTVQVQLSNIRGMQS